MVHSYLCHSKKYTCALISSLTYILTIRQQKVQKPSNDVVTCKFPRTSQHQTNMKRYHLKNAPTKTRSISVSAVRKYIYTREHVSHSEAKTMQWNCSENYIKCYLAQNLLKDKKRCERLTNLHRWCYTKKANFTRIANGTSNRSTVRGHRQLVNEDASSSSHRSSSR